MNVIAFFHLKPNLKSDRNVLGGWQFSTITLVQHGSSVTTRSWDSAGQAIVPDGNRLNCVAGATQVSANPNPNLYYVPSAFTNTTAGQFGACGRNNLLTPSQWNIDFSTLKDFRISERHRSFERLRPDSIHQPVTADSVRSQVLFLRTQ